MQPSDIDALMRGAAPVFRDYVEQALKPLAARIVELEQQLAAIPPARHGAPGRDGADGAPGEKGDVGAQGKDGAEGLPGRGITKALLDKNGHLVLTYTDGTTDDVGLVVGKDGSDGKDGADGADGAIGKLRLAKAWIDAVHREGDVVTHEGGTYQAARDTGKAPPHADWICLAAPGRAGKDADQIEVRGTYEEGGKYKRLNIVALNGGAWIAREDDPGPCPGDGWQVLAMRGKAGPPGEARKGDPGIGIKGDPGPRVERLDIDLYPVLRKIGG